VAQLSLIAEEASYRIKRKEELEKIRRRSKEKRGIGKEKTEAYVFH
jgi:hypothetical protein